MERPGRSSSTKPPRNSSVAIVQNEKTLPLSPDCNGEISSEDDDFEETKVFYSIPGWDQGQRFLNSITHPPIEKHSNERQVDHIEDEDEDFEKFDESIDLVKKDIRNGRFNCAQGRLLNLGLEPEHMEKILRDLVLKNSIGYENLAIEAVVFTSDSHPSTITIFVDVAIQTKRWEDLQHFVEKSNYVKAKNDPLNIQVRIEADDRIPSKVKEACLRSLEPIKKISVNAIGGPPDLGKTFDCLIKGALQNRHHDPQMTKLNVTINRGENIISVWYNGKGLPVVLDSVKGKYIPTIVFQRVVLEKLPCISLVVETGDSLTNKRFKQKWHCETGFEPPVVQDNHGEYFACCTFKIDTSKMEALTKSMVDQLNAKVYDVVDNYGECTGSTIRVLLNGVLQFQDTSTIHKIDSAQLNSYASITAERNDSMPRALQVKTPHESESRLVILCAETPRRDEETMSPLPDMFQGLPLVSHQLPMALGRLYSDELATPHESESRLVILCAETPRRDEETMSPLPDELTEPLSPHDESSPALCSSSPKKLEEMARLDPDELTDLMSPIKDLSSGTSKKRRALTPLDISNRNNELFLDQHSDMYMKRQVLSTKETGTYPKEDDTDSLDMMDDVLPQVVHCILCGRTGVEELAKPLKGRTLKHHINPQTGQRCGTSFGSSGRPLNLLQVSMVVPVSIAPDPISAEQRYAGVQVCARNFRARYKGMGLRAPNGTLNFDTAEDAAQAFDQAVKQATPSGQISKLNFPNPRQPLQQQIKVRKANLLAEKRANVTGAYKCRDCGLEVDEVNIQTRLNTQCRDCFLIDKREQKRIRGQLNPLAKWTLEKFDNMKFRTSEWNVIRSKAGNPSLIMGWKNAEELMNSLFPEKSMDNHFTIICAVSRRGLWNSEDNRHDKETLDCVSVERKNNNQFEVATVASYTGSNVALVANLFQLMHRTLHWDQDYFKKIKELYNHRIMVVRHDPNIFVHAIADFKLQGENSRNNIVRWIKAKISDATRHVLTKSKDRTVGNAVRLLVAPMASDGVGAAATRAPRIKNTPFRTSCTP